MESSDEEVDVLNKTVSEIDDLDSDTCDYAMQISGVDVTEWTQSSNEPLTELAPMESVQARWKRLQLEIVGESLLPSGESSNDSNDSDYIPQELAAATQAKRPRSVKRAVTTDTETQIPIEHNDAADACINEVIDSFHNERPLIQRRPRSLKMGALQSQNQKRRLHGKSYFSVAVKCTCVASRESYNQQNDYICSLLQETPLVRVTKFDSKRPRSCIRVYNIPSEDPEATEPLIVCKSFFLGTFDVDKDRVLLCLQNRNADGTYSPKQTNGRAAGLVRKEISQKVRQPIRDFIESLPAQKPHYSRTQGCLKDAYIDLENVHRLKDMYRIFKKTRIEAKDDDFASRWSFDMVFKTEYQIGIARPIKDKCNTCTKFKHTVLFDAELLENQEQHKRRAHEAQASKRKDKESATNDPSIQCFTFDLQSVLYTPFSTDSVLFYTRKLAFYNLTIWNQVNKDVECYLWSEVDGRRGSNEIGSCIYDKLMSLNDDTKRVVLYSDTCAGQNRNKLMIAFFMHIVESTHLECITQKFMESGHSEMEVDAAHSCIESKRRGSAIYGREGWRVCLEGARQNHPFKVIDMTFNKFYDLKNLLDQYNFKQHLIGVDGAKMQILKVKQLKFEKVNDSCTLFYNYGFNEDDFIGIDLSRSVKRTKQPTPCSKLLKKTYIGVFPISLQKKADLVGLVNQGLIPEFAHDFFLNLPASAKIEDRLSSPANDELSEVEY